MRKAVGKILKMKKKDANWKKQKSNKSEGDESGKSSGDSNGNCSAAKVRHIYIMEKIGSNGVKMNQQQMFKLQHIILCTFHLFIKR